MLHYVIQAQDLQELQQWTQGEWKDSLQDCDKVELFTLYIPKLQTRSRVSHIPARRRSTDKQHGGT